MTIYDTLTEIAMQADNSMAPHLTDNDELSPVDALARISKLAWAAVEDLSTECTDEHTDEGAHD